MVANHADLGDIVRAHGVPFHHVAFPSEGVGGAAEGKTEAFAQVRKLVNAVDPDAIVLARETGIAFCGPWVLGVLLQVLDDAEERARVVAEAEAVLAGPTMSHNHIAYRRLAIEGARVLVVPAAFTAHTGRDHWEVLLRARAIENQCYVVAAGQTGDHDPGRSCYGRSMVVDPWGTIVAQAVDGVGTVVADLDLERVARIRSELPSLTNRRLV